MTTVAPVQAATSNAATQASGSPQTVDYDAFLQLLIAQMQNQDPTNPMSETEYVAQLASFSNVEQSTQLNQKLDQLLQMSSIDQAASFIGRTVTSFDGSISGEVQEVRIRSDGAIAVLEGGAQLPIGPGLVVS